MEDRDRVKGIFSRQLGIELARKVPMEIGNMRKNWPRQDDSRSILQRTQHHSEGVDRGDSGDGQELGGKPEEEGKKRQGAPCKRCCHGRSRKSMGKGMT